MMNLLMNIIYFYPLPAGSTRFTFTMPRPLHKAFMYWFAGTGLIYYNNNCCVGNKNEAVYDVKQIPYFLPQCLP